VNAYEVKAGMVLFAGKTVWSMPERLRGFTTKHYINPRYLYLYLIKTEAWLRSPFMPSGQEMDPVYSTDAEAHT